MRLVRRLAVKLLIGLITIWVVASGTFFLVRLMPGDPVAAEFQQQVQTGMSPAAAAGKAQQMYGFLPHQSLTCAGAGGYCCAPPSGCSGWRSSPCSWCWPSSPYLYPKNLPIDPNAIYAPPSLAHPLGTDFEGTDVLVLVITGTRYMLLSAVVAGLITVPDAVAA